MNTKTNTAKAPALTKGGKTLLTIIGAGSVSFFDDGIVENGNTWHDVLTEETAGAPGMPKTARGVSNIIRKLADDGYLYLTNEGTEEVGVFLTALGAETANSLVAPLSPEKPEPAAEKPAKAEKKPAAKKAGKTAAKKTAKKEAPRKGSEAQEKLTRHIAEVFSKVPAGTFIKARDITNAITKEYPTEEVRPSVHTVFARCRGTNLPAGVTGQRVPCGATKN